MLGSNTRAGRQSNAMPRFRPGLWPTLAAIVVIAATASLGKWQYNRAAQKASLQGQLAAARSEIALPLKGARDVDRSMRYRRVAAIGTFDASRQIWIDNRTYKGTAGYYVLTPMRLADGSHVIVNRGWVAAAKMRDSIPPAPPPSGEVQVTGALNLPPPSFLALSSANVQGSVWQNLDLDAYAAAQRIDVAPLVIEQWLGANDGLVRDWPVPDFGRDTNISYMWQWWSFGILALVFWVVLGFRAGRVQSAGQQEP